MLMITESDTPCVGNKQKQVVFDYNLQSDDKEIAVTYFGIAAFIVMPDN